MNGPGTPRLVTVPEPLFPLKQSTLFVWVVKVKVFTLVMAKVELKMQLFEDIEITVYIPWHKDDTLLVVIFIGLHVKEYGAMAPVAEIVAKPEQKQFEFVYEVVMPKGCKAAQPLFMEFIQAALAGLFGKPGVSFPDTD